MKDRPQSMEGSAWAATNAHQQPLRSLLLLLLSGRFLASGQHSWQSWQLLHSASWMVSGQQSGLEQPRLLPLLLLLSVQHLASG